jgi:hypothetical protein
MQFGHDYYREHKVCISDKNFISPSNNFAIIKLRFIYNRPVRKELKFYKGPVFNSQISEYSRGPDGAFSHRIILSPELRLVWVIDVLTDRK